KPSPSAAFQGSRCYRSTRYRCASISAHSMWCGWKHDQQPLPPITQERLSMNTVATAEAAPTGRLKNMLGFLDSDPDNVSLLADAAEAALDAREPDIAI